MARYLGLALIITGIILSLLLPNRSWAHELILDSSHRLGLVLHLEPDDDPVAGRQTGLNFELDNPTLATSQLQANLEITDNRNQLTVIPVIISGDIISGDYTFANPGTYQFRLTILVGGSDRYVFDFDQTVSRSLASGQAAPASHPWAVAMLVFSLGLLTGLFSLWRRYYQPIKT